LWPYRLLDLVEEENGDDDDDVDDDDGEEENDANKLEKKARTIRIGTPSISEW